MVTLRLCLVFALLLFIVPLSVAEVNNYFTVKDVEDTFSVVPGDDIVISFNVYNQGLVSPKNVTAYLEPCPVGWNCETKDFAFDDEGRHYTNLSISIPGTAIPRKYTLYLLLESEHNTLRGDDRIIVTVMSDAVADVKTYDEYIAELEVEAIEPEPELFNEPILAPPVEVVEPEHVDIEDVDPDLLPEPAEDIVQEDKPDILEDFERLESSRQFVEYVSVILGVLLVFIAVAAFVTYNKKE